MYYKISKELIDFIKQNPTVFHTVNSIKNILEYNDFTELSECKGWTVKPGKGYYVRRNGSGIIAFKIGNNIENYGFNIIAAHTDSPCFKLKENAELHISDKYTKLNTEGYGGMICSTWLDKPLSVAGRVIVRTKTGDLQAKLLNIQRDIALIPNVAIHMNREINDDYSYNKQVDMLPLVGGGLDEDSLKKLIANELNIHSQDILGTDLYLYPRQKGTVWGINNEFISSPRLDDQQCVFAGLKALLNSQGDNTINILACFDNEEVGSGTKQGADSTLLYDTLVRINKALGKSQEDYYRALACGFMLSADNAHAVHPNHPELTDQNNNAYMNEGVVVKSHAGQKYTSDGMSMAIIKEIANRANVPLQYFSNRSDKPGGSTLGNISMAHVSIKCVDIGLSTLSMHSSCETGGVKDTAYMIDLMKEFYRNKYEETGDGAVSIR